MALLKVGELARHSGLTVRALHHYDQIGLLQPSARSEAGYRLYNRDDVARLHGIQALRGLGLGLKAVAQVLDGGGLSLAQVLAQQRRALDQQISQARHLRDQLQLLASQLSAGEQPAMTTWLAALTQMSALARHFSVAEIRRLEADWVRVADEWPPLLAELRQMQAQGVPPDDLRLQPLAQRWMGLIHHWLGGDFQLIGRWGDMYKGEPLAHRPGGPDLALVRYIEPATERRLARWLAHLSQADLSRFCWVPTADWQALAQAVRAAIASGLPPGSPEAAALRARGWALFLATAGGDAGLLRQAMAAVAGDAVLQAGAMLPADVQAWLAAGPPPPAEVPAA